jgi:hypothetical protein
MTPAFPMARCGLAIAKYMTPDARLMYVRRVHGHALPCFAVTAVRPAAHAASQLARALVDLPAIDAVVLDAGLCAYAHARAWVCAHVHARTTRTAPPPEQRRGGEAVCACR